MINETKQRIEAYKAALPGLKERITAVALLLAMSVAMMTSATYAWIVLSRSPEVEGMATNVTSNGSLEIALAKPDGSLPAESAIGDSAATPGQSLVNSNLTWGNMVNLSDASYGLQAISLRPALLSGFNLNVNPLYGATYGDDGRLISTSDVYNYVSYTKYEGDIWGFAATTKDNPGYGVRGIASLKKDNTAANATLIALQSSIRTAYAKTNGLYLDLIEGNTKVDETRNISCMDALATLLEVYVNELAANVLDDKVADYSGNVTYMYRMMQEFRKILDAEGEALVLLANLQVYAKDQTKTTEYFKSIDELTKASASTLSNLGVTLESLATYKTDCSNLDKSINDLKFYAEVFDPDTGTGSYTDSAGATVTTVTWSQLSTPVNRLVVVREAELNNVPIKNFNASNVTEVFGILNAKEHNALLTQGVLPNTEQRIGNHMEKEAVVITIKITEIVKKTINASVKTNAKTPFLSDKDMAHAFSLGASGEATDAVAKDTYGMAIDMWVRSNAENTILTLEGNILTKEVDAITTDKNGNDAVLWSMTYEGAMYDVYQLAEEEEGVTVTNWYDAHSNTKIGSVSELTEEAGYEFEKQTVQVVTGFAGENRVWENWDQIDKAIADGMIDANFSTQGSGSCYVFYAESETDKVRILNMLKAFTVAFLNQQGEVLATAKLDTEHHYAINGKVTVPMMMVSGTSYIDENGVERKGITSLVRNTATWITAVVYLDGMQLTNSDVLAVGEIEGRLNLQYGSSVNLVTMGNDDLVNQYREFVAKATSSAGSSDKVSNPINYTYDATAKKITVTVTPTGDQPGTVSGFFVRTVSETQGSKGDTVEFTENDDGTWSGMFELTRPGTYSFQSVIADGVEYDLYDHPTVVIEGLGISSIRTDLATGVSLTSNTFIDAPVMVDIDAAPELMPKQVRAQFWSDDNQAVNAILSYEGDGIWKGTARFNSSGTYTMKYIIMDGDETLLDTSQQTTHILYLGITAVVSTTYSPLSFIYEGEEYRFPMRVEIYDNAGTELTGLEDVRLYYRVSGSAIDQGGMSEEVKWNESTGYYEGTFLLPSPGVFVFNRVTISEDPNDGVATSTIEKAGHAPVFTAISPNPPEYMNGNKTQEYQFVPDGGATMSVDIKYGNTATVWAVIADQHGNEYLVESAPGSQVDLADTYRFTFAVPKNEEGTYNGKQDGQWTIKALALQGVYILDESGESGKMYAITDTKPTLANYNDGDTCYVFDLTDKTQYPADKYPDVTTKVVQTVNVTVSDHKKDFGKDGNGNVTGQFLQEHSLSGVTFSITDWAGTPIQNLKGPMENDALLANPAVNWAYNNNPDGDPNPNNSVKESYGWYTASDNVAAKRIQLTGSGANFTLPTQILQRAGTYTVTLEYSVDGVQYIYDQTLTYEVWSIKPTVTIDSISPNKAHKTLNDDGEVDVTSGINGNTITIYCEMLKDGRGSKLVTYPQVNLKLSGIGNADTATMAFTTNPAGSNVYMYTADGMNGQTDAFTWQTDGVCTRFIGRYKAAGTCSGTTKTGAGTLQASTLTLTHKEGDVTVEFTVNLGFTITINNPTVN